MKFAFGLYEGIELFPVGQVLIEILTYLKSSLNLTDERVLIDAEDVQQFTTNNLLKQGVDLVLIPYTMNAGWDYKYYAYTSPIVEGDTVIWACKPPKQDQTSFARFYVFDLPVTLCIFSSLLCVSLATSFITKLVSLKRVKYGRILGGQLWSHFWSFFRIGVPLVSKRDSYRILLAFWLIMVLLLSVQQSCSFTAKMSFSTYLTIREFLDIKHYPDAIPKVMKGSVVDEIYKDKTRSNWDLYMRKRYYVIEDFALSETLPRISEGKQIMVINDFYLPTIAQLFLESNSNYQFQFSPPQGAILQGFLMSRNLSKALTEDITSRMARFYACKTFDSVLILSKVYLFLNTWQSPINEDKDPPPLKFKDFYLGFRAILIGHALSVFLAIFQALHNLKPTKRLRNK